MRPSQVFQTMEVVRNSFSRPLSRKGILLSQDDQSTVYDVYEQWILLLVDLGYLPPDELKRTGQRLWSDMLQVDVLDLNNSFTEGLQSIRMKSVKGFKALCNRISSHLYHLIKSDLNLIPQGDVSAARRLMQVFAYTSRLTLKDIDLTQQQLADYLQIEEQIPDDCPEDITKALNKIIRRWLGSFCPGDIHPSHGPGGVARLGRCALIDKYNDLSTDDRLRYAFGDPWWVVSSDSKKLERISKTIFVPKSYKSFRTISMEPATLQYFQQGVWKQIDEYVRRHVYLRNRIDFHDQSRNRALAQQGSICRNYATLDLSAASDSVSYALIKKVFRGTWLPRYFLATRSTHTLLPDGRVIGLKKFAPMGSALCFPIETLLFASVCEYVTRAHRLSGDFSVFGDDIIVPTACAEETISVLSSLGFKVNLEKSFYKPDSWFRESCGGEYVCGSDVTPLRVSRKYAHRERLERLAGLKDLANAAYQRGFRNLRYFFLYKLRKEGYVVLFGESHLLGDNYTNYHAKSRWNSNLQRLEVKVTTLISESQKIVDPKAEDIRYRHWLESTIDRFAVFEAFQSNVGKATVRTKLSWVSKPYVLSDQEKIDAQKPSVTS